FLADAAHELRTPITTLRIQADSLPDTSHKAPLVRATTRLMTLAEQLLDLQRLERARASTQLNDLREICERAAGELAPLAVMSECSIALDAPRSVFVRVDGAAIERAVGNLIQNAIEHGGRHGEIQVLVQAPGTIVVNDSGPGIPLEERERVVEPFHRIHPRGRGAGLGLHLVSEVAQMHGGRLIVDESPAGGASVRIVLVSASSAG
ncbi:MAG TPA: HAMP domain-containing sensor histidine kinase, partial [Burkholderiaceae bacterium]|nr:HAMP domain-containing sensor histidine kinase [Burkholderiaceae bacterium]